MPELLHSHPAAGLLQRGLAVSPRNILLARPERHPLLSEEDVSLWLWLPVHAAIVGHAVGGVFCQQRSRAVPRMPVMLHCGLLGHTWYLHNRNCLLPCQSCEAVAASLLRCVCSHLCAGDTQHLRHFSILLHEVLSQGGASLYLVSGASAEV